MSSSHLGGSEPNRVEELDRPLNPPAHTSPLTDRAPRPFRADRTQRAIAPTEPTGPGRRPNPTLGRADRTQTDRRTERTQGRSRESPTRPQGRYPLHLALLTWALSPSLTPSIPAPTEPNAPRSARWEDPRRGCPGRPSGEPPAPEAGDLTNPIRPAPLAAPPQLGARWRGVCDGRPFPDPGRGPGLPDPAGGVPVRPIGAREAIVRKSRRNSWVHTHSEARNRPPALEPCVLMIHDTG